MATFTPFTWIRHGTDISVVTASPGAIQEEIWIGDYGDTFDIVTSFGLDNGPATRAFDPQSLVYESNPNSLVPYLSSATMFTGFKQGAFDVARGDLVQNTVDPLGTLDENGFSGTIWDSVKHLSLDVDIYQLPSLHDDRTFLLSTTPFTVDTKSTENGVVTSQTHEVGVYEGANPVPQLIGQFIEWKRIDKDTGAESIEYRYIWAGSGNAFSQWQQGYGGWRFMLEGMQDQQLIDHVQDGLLMQRRFMVVGGYANDGLASWYAQGGVDSSTMPSPGINSPDADWFVPVGLGQYTLISDSNTPNFVPIHLEKQTNNWPGNADGGVTGGTIGTAKSDFLIGTGGVEWLKSKGGDDLLEGKGGGDKLDGSTGFDIATYVSATVKVTVSLKTPSLNTGDARGDTYYSIEGLLGSNFDDTITGNDAANYLAGGLGRDKIFGLGGNDELVGGSGNDTLTGGLGRDTLSGDAGLDVFDFNYVSESRAGAATRDVIGGFVHLVDKIDLVGIDANSKIVGNQPFKFIGSVAFHKVAGELRFHQTSTHTYVKGDINGDGVADFELDLLGKVALSKVDFYL